ncbi:unnamed protein product [Linum trigynum]|uniref:Reverse transcriptase domain-containing protein n=1 Tax=Linum trigynum TaxID=586398 RepID=A0AAV2FIB4_9ROSI
MEQQVDRPWLLTGDWNSILKSSEKQGGAPLNMAKTKAFRDCMEDCRLMDLGFTGPRFTWFTSKSNLKERLDRSICNLDWHKEFPSSFVTHLPKIKSDHRPILTCSSTDKGEKKPVRRFQFLAPWLTHDDFFPFLQSVWKRNSDFHCALQGLTEDLKDWNQNVFGNIFKRKRELLNCLKSLELINCKNPTRNSTAKEQETREELENTLWQEELLWIQKSRANWVVFGDMNTSFFHNSTLSRRKHNRILSLKDDNGQWVTDPEALELMARTHYVKLYSREERTEEIPLPADFPRLDAHRLLCIGSMPTVEEIRATVMEMNGLKAPGKDGYQALFYQKCWTQIKKEFTLFIQMCFREHKSIELVNETLLALIPKVEGPCSMNQFRPISLCNVGYKVVAKRIANKLKTLMPDLVHPNQSSFVPKRHITDNIIILQEAVHSMSKKSGKKGNMLLKIDLAKAYDRIDWHFLENTLKEAHLPNDCISLIMACVTSTSFQVLWNGGATESFKPSRGLRQGCPLSPYLFTLCIERLSHCILSEVKNGNWKPMKLSADGPPLSHLFFADDLVLFAEANPKHAEVVMSCMERFCLASGELISKEKSRVFFSKNTTRATRGEVCSRLGIQETQDLGRYLGMPVIHGRVTKSTYRFILEKIDNKLTAWKARTLSLAGRVTLALAVLNAIPNYAMQTSPLPAAVCDEIDRKIRMFVWGGQAGKKKTHLLSWNTVCKPKSQGGLRLRSAPQLEHGIHDQAGVANP